MVAEQESNNKPFDWSTQSLPIGKFVEKVSDTLVKKEDSDSFDWGTEVKKPTKKKEDDSYFKSLLRYAYQVPSGFLSRLSYPLNILQMIGEGDALQEYEELSERLPELRKKFPFMNLPEEIDKDAYMESLHSATSMFPTQQNIERGIENLTGAPLTPQTPGQNLLNMASSAAAFRTGGLAPKATAAAVTPAAKVALDASGVPEGVSDVLAYTVGAVTPTPSIGKSTKPSGLTERRYENLKKDTKVTPTRFSKITKAVEDDFRSISENLIEKNSDVATKLRKNPYYKEEILESFEKVKDLSSSMPGEVKGRSIRESMMSRVNNREMKGISPDEYEKTFRKESAKLYKEINPNKKFNAENIVDQFRKNNKALGEIFESGKSAAQNRAKADALLEYNRTLASIIDNQYEGTEFSKLFSESNKLYSQIMDVETVNAFVDSLFEGKIKYDKAAKFMDKPRLTKAFKNVLGKEGYNEFSQLMKDLMGSKEGYSKLRQAQLMGYTDLAKHGATWLINPIASKVKMGIDVGKNIYKTTLSNPKMITRWESALKNFKAGNFAKAEKAIKELRENS